jgi:phytoene dehydrogenase-like protein
MPDVLIIGGGHNALVAAFYLARGGLKPLVLERRPQPGGGAVTDEIHPGFRGPTLSHDVLLHERIVRDMALARHGLQTSATEVDVCALSPTRPPLVLYAEPGRTAEALRRTAPGDADAYGRYRESVRGIASVLGPLLETVPPDIDRPGAADLWNLLKAGRRFRGLARREQYRLLRWGPMPVADLVAECFEDELLRATVAAPGLSGTMFGPRSAGSALVLLLREAHRQLAGGRGLQVRGGPGALTGALAAAARGAGAEIRTDTEVERIVVRHGRASAVIAGGREIEGRRIVSAVDPATTFLRLVDPIDLTPDFAAKMRNYRVRGTMAKVNLALSALPAFGVDAATLGGRIHIGPELDYLERAFDHVKYGELSPEPWLDLTLPTIGDPSLAPGGAHVASIYVHYAPFRLRAGDWNVFRDRLLEATLRVVERYAPGIRGLIVAAQVITPQDLEATYGFGGGNPFHGEMALDQLFTMRPLLGYGRYGTPIPGLYLCGGGTHPGGFLTGSSGRLAARAILATREI